MVSSGRQIIACIILVISAFLPVSAQTKAPSGSISGKVTIKNKPVAGIVVTVRPPNRERTRYRATSDDTGTYHITNLPAGAYLIGPMTFSLIQEDARSNNIILGEGEAVEDMNFALLPGGVITGKITDTDGRPLIEESITIWPLQPTPANEAFVRNGGDQTDDRGLYRVFGLKPGKYRVSVGQGEWRITRSSTSHRMTYYPSVTDVTKSVVIEVKEGTEVNNIDIVVGRPPVGFKVAGRIVDGETGKPVTNLLYGIIRTYEGGSEGTSSGSVSDSNGGFKFDNVPPGKYAVFISTGQQNLRAEPVPFEVVDRDVTDIVVKTVKGTSISGVVVLEGADAASSKKPIEMYLEIMTENPENGMQSGNSVFVKPDGTFMTTGLRAGRITFGYLGMVSRASGRLAVTKIERDGIEQPQGISITDGEQISGVRLTVKYLTGAIRGEVKVEGNELPANSRMSVWVQRVDERRMDRINNQGAQLDSRNRFLIEGLAGGTYEVTVAVYDPNRRDSYAMYKEQVTVNDNAVSDVTVTVKPKP
jgi:protocatechuate 3,4-dioxygenase beta subunit